METVQCGICAGVSLLNRDHLYRYVEKGQVKVKDIIRENPKILRTGYVSRILANLAIMQDIIVSSQNESLKLSLANIETIAKREFLIYFGYINDSVSSLENILGVILSPGMADEDLVFLAELLVPYTSILVMAIHNPANSIQISDINLDRMYENAQMSLEHIYSNVVG